MDSNAAHARSFVEAFGQFGKKVAFEDLICLIGMGADDILEKFLTKNEIEEFGKDLKEFRKSIFLKRYLPEIEVFPNVRELFERLKADEKQTALASSASEDELEKYREKLNLSDLLDEETNADEAENAKPEPDIFLAAFQKLKRAEKENVLVIGDTPYDAEAARKAKLEIVGVESGGWSRGKLLEKGCSEVYENIGGIFENYEKIFLSKTAF
jgi:HAD superfamily hydrolase (TIGR01549 family)